MITLYFVAFLFLWPNFNGRLIKVKKHIESKRNRGKMSGFK